MFFEGPKLPKTLRGHSCVTQGTDMIVIGGRSITGWSSDLFKLKLVTTHRRHEGLDTNNDFSILKYNDMQILKLGFFSYPLRQEPINIYVPPDILVIFKLQPLTS